MKYADLVKQTIRRYNISNIHLDYNSENVRDIIYNLNKHRNDKTVLLNAYIK